MSLEQRAESPEERHLVGNWKNAAGRINNGGHVLGI